MDGVEHGQADTVDDSVLEKGNPTQQEPGSRSALVTVVSSVAAPTSRVKAHHSKRCSKNQVSIYVKIAEELRETADLLKAHHSISKKHVSQVETRMLVVLREHSFSNAMNLAGDRADAVVASAIDGPTSSMDCAKCLVVTMPEEMQTNQDNEKTVNRVKGVSRGAG